MTDGSGADRFGPMHGRRLAEEEAEPLAPTQPRAVTAPAELLQLQQSAGNHAVGRMIAARQTLARDLKLPEVPKVTEADRVKKLEADYAAAVTAKNWDQVALLVNGFNDDDLAAKLSALSQAEIRLVDDATERSTAGLQRVSTACEKALQGKGVSAARSKAGAQYGDLKFEVTEVTHGELFYKKAAYGVKITFTPDTAVAKADEIGFIQTSRLTNTKTKENADWDEGSKKRATKDKVSIDRQYGFKEGWYGVSNEGGEGSFMKLWKKKNAASQAFAEMKDVAGSKDHPNTSWLFETAVVSRSGPDAGTVYATVTWGFLIDDKMKVSALPQHIYNKQSAQMDAAVGKWNEQAKGSKEDSNAPVTGGQVALPTLK